MADIRYYLQVDISIKLFAKFMLKIRNKKDRKRKKIEKLQILPFCTFMCRWVRAKVELGAMVCWPWLNDLAIKTWPRYFEDIPVY